MFRAVTFKVAAPSIEDCCKVLFYYITVIVKPGYNALEGTGPQERYRREMSFGHNQKGNHHNSDF